jgi:hypothetical protein
MPGVLSQPRRQGLGGPVRQQLDRPATLKIHENGPIALAPPPGPVIDAEHARIDRWRRPCPADQAKEGRSAGRHLQTAPDAGTGAAAEGEPDLLQRRQEWRAGTGTVSRQPRYLLGEDAPRALRRRAPEATPARSE